MSGQLDFFATQPAIERLVEEEVTSRADAMAMASSALLSPCGLYRYTLTRRWGEGRTMLLSGINPSSANATDEDNTSRRVIDFAKREGCGAAVIVNPWGLISTKPKGLLTAADPVGPGNDDAIRSVLDEEVLAVVAWGAWAFETKKREALLGPRITAMLKLLAGRPLYCFGLTADGHPKHPLYLAADTLLVPYAPRGA